jgi:nitrate reductase NapE component
MKDMYLESSSQVAQSERVVNYLYNLLSVFPCLTVAVCRAYVLYGYFHWEWQDEERGLHFTLERLLDLKELEILR